MNTVLVIGCGQIGTFAAEALARRGVSVIGCDTKRVWDFFVRYGPRKSAVLESGDALDADSIRRLVRKYRVEAIVFAAGFTGKQAEHQLRNWRVTVDGAREVARVAVTERVARLVFISSFAVYGIPSTQAVDESGSSQPMSEYGRVKARGEAVLEAFRADGLEVRILRPCGVYGPHPIGHGSRSVLLIEQLLARAIWERDLLVKAPSQDLDEYIYVRDVAEAIALATLREKATAHHVFNVGAGIRATARDLALALEQVLPDRRVVLELVKQIPEDRRQMPPLNIDRIRVELGFVPRFSLADGLAAYVRELGISPSCPLEEVKKRIIKQYELDRV